MVGVGGRSKACDNCYRRRVKCDETKPQCKRCSKAGLECGGYKPMTIIQYEVKSKRSPNSDSTPDSGSLAVGLSPNSSTEPCHTDIVKPRFHFDIPPALDDIFVNYTLSNLLSARNQQHVVTGVERDISDKAFLALSTFFFGNEHKDHRVVEYGLRRYGKALKELNTALSDAKQRHTYDVLESVILLAMFEYLMSERPDGWIAHSVGLERLFVARGVQSFTSYADRTILERSRASIIFACLVLRKSTVLSRPEWKTVPWSAAPGRKSMIERLVDIMTDCPQLVVLQDKIKSVYEDAAKKQYALETWKHAMQIKKELQTWKKLWDTVEPKHRFEGPSMSTSASKGSPLESDLFRSRHTKYIYQSLNHANAVALYNGTLILLERHMQFVGLMAPNGDRPATNHVHAAHAAAIEIARTADFCIENARGGLGSFYILFPLRMAWAAAHNYDSALQKVLERMLHKIQFGAAGHWAIAGYVLNLANLKFEPAPQKKNLKADQIEADTGV